MFILQLVVAQPSETCVKLSFLWECLTRKANVDALKLVLEQADATAVWLSATVQGWTTKETYFWMIASTASLLRKKKEEILEREIHTKIIVFVVKVAEVIVNQPPGKMRKLLNIHFICCINLHLMWRGSGKLCWVCQLASISVRRYLSTRSDEMDSARQF